MKSDLFPVYCYTNNKSLVDTNNSTKTLTEKRLKVDVCIIREMIEKQEVKSVSWCGSSSQLTDCLTKVSASSGKLLHVLKGETNLKKIALKLVSSIFYQALIFHQMIAL